MLPVEHTRTYMVEVERADTYMVHVPALYVEKQPIDLVFPHLEKDRGNLNKYCKKNTGAGLFHMHD